MNAKTVIATLIASLMIAPVALAHGNTHNVNFGNPAYTIWSANGLTGNPCEQYRVTAASLPTPWTGPLYTFGGHAGNALFGIAEQLHYAVVETSRDDSPAGSGLCGSGAFWATSQHAKAAIHGRIVTASTSSFDITWSADSITTWSLLTGATLSGGCSLFVNGAFFASAPLNPVTGTCTFSFPPMPGMSFEIYAGASAVNPVPALAALQGAGNPLQTMLTVQTTTGPSHQDDVIATLTP